jgi:predicted metal-dependent hydrolase
MSFRKREVEKILLMKSSRSKGKTKVQKTEEEDKIISDWLQKTGYDYLKDFDGTVLVPIKKNKGYKKDQANDDLKKEYQKLYENFADNYYDSRKKIFRNNVPDEE